MVSARRIRACFVILLLTACAGYAPEDVQTVEFWALGWHFTATQNRIQPAIPPVVQFLRQRYPGIRPAEPGDVLTADFQKAVLGASPKAQAHFDSRLVAALTVTGLPCAAESFPVRDAGKTVAAFVVLDATALTAPPANWMPCPPAKPAEGADRPAALRALLASLLNAVVGR